MTPDFIALYFGKMLGVEGRFQSTLRRIVCGYLCVADIKSFVVWPAPGTLVRIKARIFAAMGSRGGRLVVKVSGRSVALPVWDPRMTRPGAGKISPRRGVEGRVLASV